MGKMDMNELALTTREGTTYSGGEESNWDRLGAEEAHGLFLTILKMDRDQLDLVADILDAQTSKRSDGSGWKVESNGNAEFHGRGQASLGSEHT